MAAVMKLLFAALFLCPIAKGKGHEHCSVKNISIDQSQTGGIVHKKPRWAVILTNNCGCSQLNIKLNCTGFQTLENIDYWVLNQTGGTGECLFNNGQPIYSYSAMHFEYAWETPFPFTAISSEIYCS